MLTYAILLLFTWFCAPAPKFGGKQNQSADKNKNLRYGENLTVLKTETGVASFYSEKFHGRVTYSGEKFDMNGISAAHPFYPMGTLVRVTNLSNGKKLVLEINDRSPLKSGRIIDLSLGAARKLDFENEGLAKVKVEVLKWGKGKR